MNDDNATELYRKHRPSLWKYFKGQPDAVRMMRNLLEQGKFPHATLLVGPSGCGKTTAVRIIQKKLGCDEGDFSEMNCADSRGIDAIRDIRSRMGLSPMYGKCRVFYLDETHRLTGDSMSMLLKMLEDTPKHVYFILATTDPQKLLKTIITRCTEIRLSALNESAMREVINGVLEKEGKKVPESVIEKLVDVSDGSARKALVLLHQIIDLEDEKQQIDAIEKSDSNRQSIELARAIMDGVDWKKIAAIINGIDDEPENLRRMVLGYASKMMLSNSKPNKAYMVISAFEGNFYDSGKAGLIRACWEVASNK